MKHKAWHRLPEFGHWYQNYGEVPRILIILEVILFIFWPQNCYTNLYIVVLVLRLWHPYQNLQWYHF